MRPINKALLATAILIACGIAPQADSQNTFPVSGNVGVGTTNPQAALDVQGVLHLSTGLNGDATLRFAKDSTWGRIVSNGNIAFWANGMGFQDNIPQLMVLPNGNVGIGVTDPSFKLHIDGSMLATENVRAQGQLQSSTASFNLDDFSGNNIAVGNDTYIGGYQRGLHG